MSTDDWIAFDVWLKAKRNVRLARMSDDIEFNLNIESSQFGGSPILNSGTIERRFVLTFAFTTYESVQSFIDMPEEVESYLVRRGISLDSVPQTKNYNCGGVHLLTYVGHGFKQSHKWTAREVLTEWIKGCTNTAGSPLTGWSCEECTDAMAKALARVISPAMLRDLIAGHVADNHIN